MTRVRSAIRRTLLGPLERFVYWGTDGKTHLGQLRLATLNVCGGFFILNTVLIIVLRLFQARYFTAFIDALSVFAVLFALWLARSGKFNIAVWILAIAPPLLAFSLVVLGMYPGVTMVPQIGMCMVTCLLIFDRVSFRIAYIITCLGMLGAATYIDSADKVQTGILIYQAITFAFVFLCYTYFFERQDSNLHESILLLKESNEEKKQANEALNDRVEELLVFSHIMSHDLKGPLTSILGYAELLKLDLEDPAEASDPVESVDAITTAAKSMSSLIHDLLNYARISLAEGGCESVSLDKVVAEACGLLAFQIQDQNVDIESDPLPLVLGNADLYRTVLYNLLSNAMKYQPNDPDEPGHRPMIRLWATTTGDRASLFIQDNGIGIDPVFLPELFAPFKRDKEVHYEGTGLGMSICQGIMEKYRGSIGVYTTSESGTTFKLSFACAGDAPPEESPPAKADEELLQPSALPAIEAIAN